MRNVIKLENLLFEKQKFLYSLPLHPLIIQKEVKKIKQPKDLIKPFGKTDVLYYYSKVAKSKFLKQFLAGKEIAVKIWLGNPRMPYFLRRGSKDQPLFIEDFAQINNKFWETRKNIAKLNNAKFKLNKKQETIWHYFVPRKLIDFFYATNKEGQGKKIDRIFFDIDRSNMKPEQAQIVAKMFINEIKADKKFNNLVKYKFYIQWTGSSFHVYLMLNKPVPNSFYNKQIHFSKNDPQASFTGRWVQNINEKLKATKNKQPNQIKVAGGHEKLRNCIIIDPSQTPSGKLARAPFSLHMKDAKTIDGVAIPIKQKMLDDKNLVKKMKNYTPEKVLKEISKF